MTDDIKRDKAVDKLTGVALSLRALALNIEHAAELVKQGDMARLRESGGLGAILYLASSMSWQLVEIAGLLGAMKDSDD